MERSGRVSDTIKHKGLNMEKIDFKSMDIILKMGALEITDARTISYKREQQFRLVEQYEDEALVVYDGKKMYAFKANSKLNINEIKENDICYLRTVGSKAEVLKEPSRTPVQLENRSEEIQAIYNESYRVVEGLELRIEEKFQVFMFSPDRKSVILNRLNDIDKLDIITIDTPRGIGRMLTNDIVYINHKEGELVGRAKPYKNHHAFLTYDQGMQKKREKESIEREYIEGKKGKLGLYTDFADFRKIKNKKVDILRGRIDEKVVAIRFECNGEWYECSGLGWRKEPPVGKLINVDFGQIGNPWTYVNIF